MTLDVHDASYHGRPLWAVYGPECAPSIICAKLQAYGEGHRVLPAGTPGIHVCIWGWSVYRGGGGFRTLGVGAVEWKAKHKATFYTSQDAALSRLRFLTTPMPGAVEPCERCNDTGVVSHLEPDNDEDCDHASTPSSGLDDMVKRARAWGVAEEDRLSLAALLATVRRETIEACADWIAERALPSRCSTDVAVALRAQAPGQFTRKDPNP